MIRGHHDWPRRQPSAASLVVGTTPRASCTEFTRPPRARHPRAGCRLVGTHRRARGRGVSLDGADGRRRRSSRGGARRRSSRRRPSRSRRGHLQRAPGCDSRSPGRDLSGVDMGRRDAGPGGDHFCGPPRPVGRVARRPGAPCRGRSRVVRTARARRRRQRGYPSTGPSSAASGLFPEWRIFAADGRDRTLSYRQRIGRDRAHRAAWRGQDDGARASCQRRAALSQGSLPGRSGAPRHAGGRTTRTGRVRVQDRVELPANQLGGTSTSPGPECWLSADREAPCPVPALALGRGRVD
jgi:hypothetical protein